MEPEGEHADPESGLADRFVANRKTEQAQKPGDDVQGVGPSDGIEVFVPGFEASFGGLRDHAVLILDQRVIAFHGGVDFAALGTSFAHELSQIAEPRRGVI